ncbi:MAG: NIL domain-containing protein [Chloroflexi bacterium]|nr:NIL domain-containing protein [Chloroflexota bacterium]
MAKQRVKFTFPSNLITEPVIYELGRKFDVITNIRRANVTAHEGWVILEIDGEPEDIEKGIQYVISKGVRVDPVEGDVFAG